MSNQQQIIAARAFAAGLATGDSFDESREKMRDLGDFSTALRAIMRAQFPALFEDWALDPEDIMEAHALYETILNDCWYADDVDPEDEYGAMLRAEA